MAQTTTFTGGSGFYIAVATDGSTWNSIEGSSNKIEVSEQKRMNGVAYTPDTDTAVISYGKLEPVEITVTCIYTKTSGEAWARVKAAFVASGGSRLDLRFAPEGNTTGNLQYTTGSSKPVSLKWPSPEAGSAGPLMFTAKWTAYLTEASVP